ncbi:origin recognition complex subunit 5-like isoform X1 [Varroa destructor]|uniref:Origin recognition complex subunit 5 n=2 Tax=Varroa destructor TaxID=109461 RepID=A0A7M7JZU2_VARDE|nr:origin recognition complex subunit 5-like isoform X1 [Varroa destructor]
MKTFSDMQVICRERQVNQLRSLLALDNACPRNIPVQAVIIFGDSGTGKSFTVKKILSAAESSESLEFKIRYVWLNCVELLQARSVFSLILNQLTTREVDSLEQISNLKSCDSAVDFLKHLFQDFQPDDRLYIVFDDSQRLRDFDPNILSFFLRIQEHANSVISCIFISTVPLSHYHTSSGFCTPHEIFFPYYTQDELCQVLLESCPSTCNTKFYEHYLRLVLPVFKNANANVKELMHIAIANFVNYTAPLAKDSSLKDHSLKLWHNIEPYLKKALESLYLREVDAFVSGETSDSATKSMNNKQIIELPLYSKFLLIAAYIASYNPPSTDRKFFVKNSGREKRKFSQIRKSKPNYHLLGPRPFPLNRLMAIFHAIVDTSDFRVEPTTILQSQVSSLVHHRLVTQTAGKDLLSAPRYKCAVDLDYVLHIANTVHFDVTQHLEDFNM